MKQTIKQVCGVLFFTLLSLSGFAQKTDGEKIITGTVMDNAGLAIPGVNVVEKGTKNGVSTDFSGKYTISVKNGAVLTFAFIGMQKVERTVGNQGIINVTLKEDATELDNVVVVGYGKQKKSNVTGSIVTAKLDEVEDLPVGDLASALTGRVLGININTSGVAGSTSINRPGEKAQLRIRGAQNYGVQGSAGVTPLYVIDGVLQTDQNGNNDSTLFENLDASEVESISFIKDGSAAIYGARAGYGVVLVTTKRGKKGEPKFSYSGSYGVDDRLYKTKTLNAYEFGNYVNSINGAGGYGKTLSADGKSGDRDFLFNEAELNHFKTINENALDNEWKVAYTTRHNLNLSGGTDRATYFGGLSYFKRDGNLGNLNYDKYSYRAGVDVSVSENLKASLQLSGYFSNKDGANNRLGGSNGENDYTNLLTRMPFVPMYINGRPAIYDGSLNNRGSMWHYGAYINSDNLQENRDLGNTVNLSVEYKFPFVKGLSAKGSYARNTFVNRIQQQATSYVLNSFLGANQNIYLLDETATSPRLLTVYNNSNPANPSSLTFENENQLSEQFNFSTSYARDFGKNNVSALFAVEKAESNYNNERMIKINAASGTNTALPTNGTTLTPGTIDSENSYSRRTVSGSLGYVGRLNYAYDDKYLAEVLFRTDASAKFAPENYWGKFWNVGLGWVISKETFFNSKVIDFLKVRYSVGKTGKDNVDAWYWYERFDSRPAQGPVFGGNNLNSDVIASRRNMNADARWSNELKTNFGIESKFLNNRLSFGFESYYNIGTEIFDIVAGGVPFTVGGGLANINYNEVDQFGYEFELGWNDKIGKDFKYGIDVRFGWSDDLLVKKSLNTINTMRPWNPQLGERTDRGFWAYDYLGMFRSQADIDQYVNDYKITTMNGIPVAQLKPGMLYYRDVRGQLNTTTGEFGAPDGVIDENDQVQLSERSAPKYSLGTTLRFSYKGLSLNTMIGANFGGGYKIISNPDRTGLSPGTDGIKIADITQNVPAIWNDVYNPVTNPNGSMPLAATNRAAASNALPSSFWSVDPFEVYIKNINLSYALPEGVLKAMKISSCRFNLTALNPFNLYNPYSYVGPEDAFLRYPTIRTVSLGVNVGF